MLSINIIVKVLTCVSKVVLSVTDHESKCVVMNYLSWFIYN